MEAFWLGLIIVLALVYLGIGVAFIILWRKEGVRKVEAALLQLQGELSRINTLLEETRMRMVGAATEEKADAAGKQPDSEGGNSDKLPGTSDSAGFAGKG